MTKNQYRGGDCLKREALTVFQFIVAGGRSWQERGGGIFEREGVDTPMHAMTRADSCQAYFDSC